MTTVEKLTDEFFFRYSVPGQHYSYQGHQSKSELIVKFTDNSRCLNLKIPHVIPNLIDWLKGTTEHF